MRVLDCFFFSSRRRHTRYWRDWSSDVCSSDLLRDPRAWDRIRGIEAQFDWAHEGLVPAPVDAGAVLFLISRAQGTLDGPDLRSEERRVGKECRSRWSPYH